jgi:type I restriction enzyme S subunit
MTNHDTNHLPEWWRETTLGENVLEVAMWPFGSNLKVDMFTESGVPIIKWGNLFWLYVNWDFTFVSEDKASSLWRSVAYPGDFIITHRWTLGQVSVVPDKPYSRYVTSQSQLRFKVNKDNINILYLLYFLKSKAGQHELLKNASQVWVPAIATPTKAIKDIQLTLPTLLEQQAIADMLSSFDTKIELLREQNETLEKTAQTIFHEWFGKYSVENPEELPEGWRVGKIMEIIKREPVSYKCDKADIDPNGTIPIIDQWTNGLYWYTSRNPDFIASPEKPVILFTNHTCNYWFIDYSFCAIQNVLPYTGKDGYDEYFLYFMTKWSITFIEYKWHWPDFEAKNFIIPSVDKAQEFSKLAKPILKKVSFNNSQIQSLSKTRDELLPRLMNGEVRI